MAQIKLYLSYGMPKSGSTLAFELTRALLETSGVPQPKIGEGVTDSKINFINKLDGDTFKALKEEAKALGGPIVIKTHSRLFPRVEKALGRGAAIGHAVYRDPRDMALSMLDAGRDGRAWGGNKGEAFQTVAEAKQRLHASIKAFESWIAAPHIIPVYYERLAFDTATVAAEIAAQLGIETDIPKAIEMATSQFTQYNQGKSQRWKTEMDPADASDYENEFAEFIGKYCQPV